MHVIACQLFIPFFNQFKMLRKINGTHILKVNPVWSILLGLKLEQFMVLVHNDKILSILGLRQELWSLLK
jgi:hypothetical protein